MATNLINVEYGYGIGQGLIPLAPRPIIAQRAPTSNDLAQLGTVWVDVPASTVYMLASITSNVPDWTTSPGSGVGIFTSLDVDPGNATITSGDLTVSAGNVDITSGNLTVGGGLTVTGTTALNGDIDINTTALFDIISTLDAAPSILLKSDGGTSEQIKLHSAQGTAVNSILLVSDAGGITLTSNLATADGINLNAAGGGVDIDGALQVNIASSQNAASAIVISASAGGIDITGAGSAGEDIDISNTASINLISSEAVVNAVVITASNAAGGIDINSGTGGMTLDSTGAISVDVAAASNFTVTGAGQDLTLSSVGGSVSILSTEDVALSILLKSDGGTSEQIKLHSVQGTAADNIYLLSDAGGITISALDVVDVVSAGGFNVTSGGLTTFDSVSGSVATPTATLAIEANIGAATFTGFTTAAGSAQVFTITNALVSATSRILVSACNEGANDAQMTIMRVNRGAGSFNITLKNNGAAALNGNVTITFFVLI